MFPGGAGGAGMIFQVCKDDDFEKKVYRIYDPISGLVSTYLVANKWRVTFHFSLFS